MTTEVAATLSTEHVYKVGDLYRCGNKVGNIFEVDATGRKGKLSLRMKISVAINAPIMRRRKR